MPEDTSPALPPYAQYIRVLDLPPGGRVVRMEPDARTLERLARHVGVVALHALTADLTVTPIAGDGARVTGRVMAEVRQVSVVSLQEFDTEVSEDVDVKFMPQADPAPAVPEEELDPEIDPPDAVVDGAIDLGALVTEFLALGIDPYPRRPGELFEPANEDESGASPFAALAPLKDKG
ncbi:DUF177 domain-containing protein [Aquabacter cavernae]|uniref:DUF177 domain-containing protein n=1 Tax=Aquabacter cavernae TaxID=2496029 RepID=UPI000F8D2FBD|nr:DUF177 domain-containing protein [Aquabacter cavernae]